MEEKEAKRLLEENEALKREIEHYQHNEKMFHALVETAVGDIGEDFFNNIVVKLSEWLNVECIIIGLLTKENIVEGFPMFLDGKIVQGFTYTLIDTPCDLTSKKGYCVFPDHVRDLFPKSKDLIELNAKGYVGTALYNKEGKPNGILCAISRKKLDLPPRAEDILKIVASRVTTEIERIKSRKELEVSEKKLRAALNVKNKLFSIISHDLKNPFNALIGFSGLIKNNLRDKKFEKLDKYISVIHDVSSQTYNMLINLLEWSMSQTNNINFNPEPFNIDDLIVDIITAQKEIAKQKNVDLNVQSQSGITINADKAMIATIIRNLVSNSIKFTPKGGKISIFASNQDNKTIVSVSDTGIGIKETDMEKLFNEDEVFSTKGTGNEKGAGLGLILCKEFVSKHRGEIWAESVPGNGTSFYFTIPLSNN
jgi:signal transduction histidine kinase